MTDFSAAGNPPSSAGLQALQSQNCCPTLVKVDQKQAKTGANDNILLMMGKNLATISHKCPAPRFVESLRKNWSNTSNYWNYRTCLAACVVHWLLI